MKRCLTLVSLVTLFMAGCTHLSTKKPTGLTAAQFWAEQTARHEELKFVSGKLGLHFETKKESVSGSGRLLTAGSSSLRLELRDPLGKLQYLVTLAGAQMIAYYPTQKMAYLDARGGSAYLKMFLGSDSSFEELRDLFLGILPRTMRPEAIGKKDFDRWDWDATAGRYVGTLKLKDRTVTVEVDGDLGVMRKMKVALPSDTVEVGFDNFSGVKNSSGERRVLAAETIDVHQKNSGAVIEVDWKEISHLNQAPPADAFREPLPEAVKKNRLN